jgi:hypothetical protein
MTPNAELAYRALDHIDAFPEQHEQGVWIANNACGTVACLAGRVCLLSGDQPDDDIYENDRTAGVLPAGADESTDVSERAAELLGLPGYDPESAYGHPLFNARNTRDDLGRLVAEIFGPRPETRDDATDAWNRFYDDLPDSASHRKPHDLDGQS